MPTWSAANDLKRGGFSSFMKEYLNSTKYLKENDGITIVNSDGIIRDEVIAILKIAYKYGMVIASGHISPNESLTLLKEINKIGNLPFIFSHPDSRSVGGTIEDMKAIIDLGGYVEICALGMMPAFQRISPNDIIKIIRNLGAENCVLSTDFFFEWAPTPPEMLRMAIATLMNAGLGENDVRRLIQLNPAKILGVEIK
jgi:microsomal dipeptidase-like Zn-dependent dipeptidase